MVEHSWRGQWMCAISRRAVCMRWLRLKESLAEANLPAKSRCVLIMPRWRMQHSQIVLWCSLESRMHNAARCWCAGPLNAPVNEGNMHAIPCAAGLMPHVHTMHVCKWRTRALLRLCSNRSAWGDTPHLAYVMTLDIKISLKCSRNHGAITPHGVHLCAITEHCYLSSKKGFLAIFFFLCIV